jgi:arylsulfatase A-like enzyme
MGKHDGLLVSDFDPTGRYARTNRHNIRGFSSEVFADTAVRFLRGQKGDQPFFMYVAFTAPHDPRTPPKKFRDLYPPAKLALPKNYLPQHMFDNGEMTVRDEKLAPWPRTPETIRTNLADYYGMITHLDEQIGRILAALAETGRADNTLVIFAGDNGLALGSHGLLGKQNLYEHSVRVPLVIRGPGIQRGLRSEALCYLLDLFPTVCELAGVAIPATVEGQSLAPVLQGKAAKGRQSIYCAYGNVQRSVRDERWKLICYTHINKAQLFDLQTDPIEMNDLIAVPAQAARVQTLVAQLTNWQAQLGDRQPLTTNPPAPALFLPRPELPQPARRIKP